MFCKNCGSQIDDNAYVCPHCGVKVAQDEVQAHENGNTLAIVGFILSFFVALAGLICSILGYQKAKNEGLPHKSLALAGIIISIVSMALSIVLYILIYPIIFAAI